MPKLEQRWEIPGRGLGFYHTPTQPRACGNSVFWYCGFCSKRYAEVRSYVDDRPSPWRARGGCCLDCAGSRWSIPGSIEDLTVIGWLEVPETVIRYQLSCELAFTYSPEHPMNRKELV